MNLKPLLAKTWVRVVLVLVALALLAFLLRNFLVRKGLEATVTGVTGFPLAIDDFDLGLLDSKVDVKGLHLTNPPGFEDPRCFSARRLAADIELSTAFGKELHIEDLDLDIEEVVVVRNVKGETSLDRLAALGGDKKDGKDGKPAPAGPPAEEKKWRCDRFHLRIDRVLFLDYSNMRHGKPKQEVYDLKVDETFQGITGPGAVIRIVVLKVLAGTPIRLANATVETLSDGLEDALDGAVKGVGGVVKGVGSTLEGIGGALGIGGKEEAPPPPPKKPVKKK